MITTEAKVGERQRTQMDIAYYARDGRLTSEPDGRRYEWRKLLARYKELGRVLTEEEAAQYLVQ